MDLVDSLAREQEKAAKRCPIGALLTSLPDDQRSALQARLDITSRDDPDYLSNAAILRALNRAGLRSSKGSIGDHRAGTCRCRT